MKQNEAASVLDEQDARERLARAEERHRELDSRVKELGRRAYLTPAEQLEVAELKKQKLKAKDEITQLKSTRF